MHPLNALMLGLVAAWAAKRRNGVDPIGRWRILAAAVGSLFAYSEVVFALLGPGAYAQAYHGLTWSAVLLPFFAFTLAGAVGAICGRGWAAVFPAIVAGLVSTWFLGLLTEEGIFPLALLVHWRVGLALLNNFDLILLGLCAVGIILALVFPIFDRDLARLTLICVVGYVLLTVFWAWRAHAFGERYAEAMNLHDVVVHELPQPLSPLNWRVIVEEPSGRLHDTLINLSRTHELKVGEGASRAARIDALYKPMDRAVWRIYRRYGGPEVPAERQRRVRAAWEAWQDSIYDWYGRYAVFDRFYSVPAATGGLQLGCVGFTDLRTEGARHPERGRYLVCPARGGGARIFQPVGAEGEGVMELIPMMTQGE
ncbi:MAG: hypothetical protein GC129_06720 [Proteobacteria bacterium]|nr:hypothetical protein [Pseudomonadota bacterium]